MPRSSPRLRRRRRSSAAVAALGAASARTRPCPCGGAGAGSAAPACASRSPTDWREPLDPARRLPGARWPRSPSAPSTPAPPPTSRQTGEVHRVLLLYSGGLDTSVMLKWIQDEYEAEVVALTVNLGQPGEDYDVVEGKALQLGAIARRGRRRARGVRARLRRPGDQGQRDLRPRLPAVHRARPAADRQARGRVRAQARLRHDRPRLHRQGQRPGPDRGDDRDARARAEGDRAGARLADGPRGGDRLRARARHPGQGRHRGAPYSIDDNLWGRSLGGPLDRGPHARARRRRLPARHAARGGARRVRDRRRSSSSAACRSRSTASGSGSSSCSSAPPRSAAGTASGSSTTSRTASSA